MTGKSFKQGYACEICAEHVGKCYRSSPLYQREADGFKFIGKVNCAVHGIQNAVKLSEVR